MVGEECALEEPCDWGVFGSGGFGRRGRGRSNSSLMFGVESLRARFVWLAVKLRLCGQIQIYVFIFHLIPGLYQFYCNYLQGLSVLLVYVRVIWGGWMYVQIGNGGCWVLQ
jgi:hypothetical protein